MAEILMTSIPVDGIEFELMLEAVRGLDMAKSNGYDTSNWRFKGEDIAESETRRFKLVSLEYCPDLDEIRDKLTSSGQEPALGQAWGAFKKAFPQNNGKGPIGFPDPSWVDQRGIARFPTLRGHGNLWVPYLDWTVGCYGDWHWLVEVK